VPAACALDLRGFAPGMRRARQLLPGRKCRRTAPGATAARRTARAKQTKVFASFFKKKTLFFLFFLEKTTKKRAQVARPTGQLARRGRGFAIVLASRSSRLA